MKKNIIAAIIIIILVSIFWNIPRIKYDVDRNGKITLKDGVQTTYYYIKVTGGKK